MNNVLKTNDAVMALFDGIEIGFTVGDCQRSNGCIKVHNVRKIDETHPGEVPSTLTLNDARITQTSIPKQIIRSYFNQPANTAATFAPKKFTEKQNTRRGAFASH